MESDGAGTSAGTCDRAGRSSDGRPVDGRPSRVLDQRPAGQPQEDVLERRAADEDRLRPEPALVDRHRACLAVVGIEQHPVGQSLDPLGEAVELAVEGLLDAGREAELGTSFVE